MIYNRLNEVRRDEEGCQSGRLGRSRKALCRFIGTVGSNPTPSARKEHNYMKPKEIKIIKSDNRGTIYDCGKSSFISRTKDTISANHTHEDPETVYLVKGEVELTIGDETLTVKAPIMFEIDSNVYHKLVALTDIELVIDRNNE